MALDILKLQFEGQDNTRQTINSVNSGINSVKKNAESLGAIKVGGGFLSGFKAGVSDATKELGGLKGAFNGLKANGDAIFSSLASGASSVASSLVSLGKTATIALGGFGSISLFKGVKREAFIENTTSDLSILVGGMEKAKQVIKEIDDFASKTPFEFPELVGTVKNLTSFGVSAGDAVEFTKRIGDLAGGSADKLNRIAQNFGQIQSLGKASSVDLKQFASVGIPIYTELARVTGKNGKALEDYISKGVDAKVINQIFKDLTNQGGKFFGLAEASSKTFSGQISTLKDNLDKAFGTFAKNSGIFDFLRVGVGEINKLLDGSQNLTDTLSNLKAAFINALPKSVKDTITSTYSQVKIFADKLTELSDKLGVTSLLTTLADAIKSVSDEISKLDFNKIVADIGKFTDSIDIDLIKSLGVAIALVGGALISMSVGASVASASVGILTGILGLLGSPLIAIGGAVALLYFVWQKNFEAINKIVADVGAFIKGVFNSIGVFFTQTIPTWLTNLKLKWDESWRLISVSFQNIWIGIKNFGITIINGILTTIQTLFNGIIDSFNSVSKKIGEITGVSLGQIDRVQIALLKLEEPIDVNIDMNTEAAQKELSAFLARARQDINNFSKNSTVKAIANATGFEGARQFIQNITGGDTGGIIGENGVFSRMAGGSSSLIPTGNKGRRGENGYLMEVHGGEHILNPRIPEQRAMLERAYEIKAPASQTNISINVSSNGPNNQSDIIAEVTRKLRLAL